MDNPSSVDSRPQDPLRVLKDHWGYSSFRPCQREIIDSVLQGHDTLGLMPTGGGKSLTFQVPALMMPGITVVVTPLISLMRDQVDNLGCVGIRAVSVNSGMTMTAIRLSYDRLRAGHAKILYVSPERLQTDSFSQEVALWDVSLIVVDEAHCISQWGYDFRPSYLHIRTLREAFPEVPVLALTASATPRVIEDICTQLSFREGFQKFSLSFARPNISYVVRHVKEKRSPLLNILTHTSGSAIVYVRSRRRTIELAAALSEAGMTAEAYHAGMAHPVRDERQHRWKTGQTRIIVATNAFGMGIDKPDVRLVIHHDLPPSLEEYYQEAGRAGRDGQPAYAVLLATPQDRGSLKRRLTVAFPPREYILEVYDKICVFLGIAIGDGYNRTYEFNFMDFLSRYSLESAMVLSALRLLSQSGYMDFQPDGNFRARVKVLVPKNQLYGLRISADADQMLLTILRNYAGLFSDYVYIDPDYIASWLKISYMRAYAALSELRRAHVIDYIPRSATPSIFLPTSRELPRYLTIPCSVYEEQRQRMEERLAAMNAFVYDNSRCRVAQMLEYFGEKETADCGICDVCRQHKDEMTEVDAAALGQTLLKALKDRGSLSYDQASEVCGRGWEPTVAAMQWLVDKGLAVHTFGTLTLK